MNKFYSKIGYAETIETSPGVWREIITERSCCGDVLKSYRQLQSGSNVNSDVVLHHNISIIADPYAAEHYADMRYIIFRNSKWRIDSIEEAWPRLTLTTGGLYNGDPSPVPQPAPSDDGY